MSASEISSAIYVTPMVVGSRMNRWFTYVNTAAITITIEMSPNRDTPTAYPGWPAIIPAARSGS